MRYVRQNYELSVSVPGGAFTPATLDAVLAEFYRVHEQAYGYAAPGEPAELVTFRVEALGLMHKASLAEQPPGEAHPVAAAKSGERQVYFGGERLATPVYARELLAPGNVVEGPSIIEQLDTTTLLLPGQRACVDRFRNMLVQDGIAA
jgi:N-methylhydantoinase A